MKGLAKLAAGVGHLGLVDRPEREPGPGQVLIEVHGTGVCGTDLHIEAGEYPTDPPVTMGHEVSGVVAATGEGVDTAWTGTRVVTETYYATCRTCLMCRSGRPNLCAGRRSIGSRADGGFASRLVVPVGNLHAVPDRLGEHAAALVEPLACVCNCLFDPPTVTAGDEVLVVGPGPMGLLAAQVAAAMGGDVTVAGLPSDAERLDLARSMGMRTTMDPAGAGLVDVAIECSGSGGGAAAALESTRPGGRYIQVGVFGRPVTVPLDRVFERELVITSGFASTPASWARAIGLVERGEVLLEPLVSRVAPLAAWAEVFDDLRRGHGLKSVIDPRL
ncbi:zinc-dependent alcohol dehydrogenase [Actinoallomurus acaciae]|uniref:Zinc-binding dehydrogenase n=1 Tax=Actinoallomurus acaciae TaxID=502577 RepID=A0ABV5Y9K1_9ACTN